MSYYIGYCPLCGSKMNVPEGMQTCYCASCGKKVVSSEALISPDGDPPVLVTKKDDPSFLVGHCPLCGSEMNVPKGMQMCYCQTCNQRVSSFAALDSQSTCGTEDKTTDFFADRQPSSTTSQNIPHNSAPTAELGLWSDDSVKPSATINKPSIAARIGYGIACFFLTSMAMAVVSGTVFQSMGFSGYSGPGILIVILAIILSKRYGATRKPTPGIAVSIIVGIALGFFLPYAYIALTQLRYG